MPVERRHLTGGTFFFDKGGRDDMTKASISLQDLRRRIYLKAKAEPEHRFWGMYVHVCKMETLWEAYRMVRQANWPSTGGVSPLW